MTLAQDLELEKATPEEEYQSMLRSLRRRKGFGLVFVRCTPVGGWELIEKVRDDIPQKLVGILELKEPISNLIDLVETFPNVENLKILFIVGLEKSLVEYIRPGYGGEGDYYNLDTVPPILSHLNWQRENYRDRFRHLCFIFLLPQFAIKYMIRRAPDFFDWGTGVVEFPTDSKLIEQESIRLIGESYEEYLKWEPHQRLNKIAEIQSYLDANPFSAKRASLLAEKGNIFIANQQYEEAIDSYDRAVQIKPDYHKAWNNRGLALGNLGRYEESIDSYDKALQIKPDYHDAWSNRGIALGNLGRYEQEIDSYDNALQIKPDLHQAWYNRGFVLVNLGKYEEAINSYGKALQIKPDYHQAWSSRGIALWNLGRYEEAIISLFQSLRIKPDEELIWDATEKLLLFFRELSKSSEKVESIKFVIQTYKDSIEILEQIGDRQRLLKFHYQLGKVFFELGNYTEAIENLQVSEQISQTLNDIPNLALSLFDLARLYHLTGKLEEARLYFKDSLRLFRRLQDPEKSAVATLALGNLEMQIGKIPQALIHLREAENYYQTQDNSERLAEINYLLQILQVA